MTGIGKEIIDMMERRKKAMLCVQETKWRGGKTKVENRNELYYQEGNGKRNGKEIILKEEVKSKVLEVRRKSDSHSCENLHGRTNSGYHQHICTANRMRYRRKG